MFELMRFFLMLAAAPRPLVVKTHDQNLVAVTGFYSGLPHRKERSS